MALYNFVSYSFVCTKVNRNDDQMQPNRTAHDDRRKGRIQLLQHSRKFHFDICNNKRLYCHFAYEFESFLQFVMWIPTKEEEGFYNLYFHACPNYRTDQFMLNFNVSTRNSFPLIFQNIFYFNRFRWTLRKATAKTFCQPEKCRCPPFTL